MQKRSQFTVEFMFIFSMAFLIFLILVIFITQFVDHSRTRSEQQRLDAFAENVKKNIMLAKDSGSGFEIKFSLPDQIDGYDYEVSIDGDVLYVENNQTGVLIYKVIPNVTGAIYKGCNRLYKDNKVINIDQNC